MDFPKINYRSLLKNIFSAFYTNAIFLVKTLKNTKTELKINEEKNKEVPNRENLLKEKTF